ncbi:MAG: hypothetical protein HKN58_00230 [Xanthomonadales bacterium]|nr:hypothetical protein [Xanthomonadales bacterium]
MTFSWHDTLKLAALALLASVLCLAQPATLDGPGFSPGSVQGVKAELAQAMPWENGARGPSFQQKTDNDSPGIQAGDESVATGGLRHRVVFHSQDRDDGFRLVALPAIRAPPLYAPSA